VAADDEGVSLPADWQAFVHFKLQGTAVDGRVVEKGE